VLRPNRRLLAMSGNDLAAPPARVAPRNVQQTDQPTTSRSSPTVAPIISLRSRRAGALRLPPIGDGPADPLDDQQPTPVQVEWGGYDVTTLGLNCPHDERCPARRRRVA